MKKKRSVLIFALVVGMLASCSDVGPTEQKHAFTYASNLGGDFTEKMYYTDDYFTASATQYNPSLATASMAMAMSAFSSNVIKSATDYSDRYHNNQELMESLGFHDYQVNKYFTEQPDVDTLGASYCYKELTDGYKLVAIGIRGQGYDREWASNFKLGGVDACNGRHQGFHEASQIALTGLQNYLSGVNITGKIKIWVAGYSRAAATTNLFAGTLDEALREGTTLFNNVTYTKDDLYAYCFEAPMGAYLDDEVSAHGEAFNNIFNVINRADPVPKVAMHEVNFTRYGIDRYVSDPLSDEDYSSHIDQVVSFFNNMKAKTVHGSYTIDDFVYQGLGDGEKKFSLGPSQNLIHWTQGQFLDRLISNLTVYGVKTREAYVEKFQNGLTSLFAIIYRQGAPKASLIDVGIQCVWSILQNSETDLLIDDLMHQINYFVEDLLPIVQTGLDNLGIDVKPADLETGLTQFLKALGMAFLADLNTLFTCLSVSNIKSLGAAHYPDLCFAHLMARDPNYTNHPVDSDMSGEYYLFEMNSLTENANIEVTRNGQTVALFNNSYPVSVDSTIAYGVQDNRMQIYLPKNGNYQITYDNGEPLISLYHPASYGYDEITPEIKKADGKNTISL